MEKLAEFLPEFLYINLPYIFALFNVCLLIVIILLVLLNRKSKKIIRHYQTLFEGVDNKNIENLLELSLSENKRLLEEVQGLQAQVLSLQKEMKTTISKVGLVRFNAFENVGSSLSFSLALLDQFGTGFVLSSLYGRDDTRVYAKPVTAGQSAFVLSEEEKEAIAMALKHPGNINSP